MIEAEIRGKLGRRYARAHERAEDLLTSTAFGLLQYLPAPWGICALLCRAHRMELCSGEVRVTDGGSWLEFPADTTCTPTFWPSAREYGQPDLLLKFERQDETPVAEVLIEVKYLSGKSSSGGSSDDEADEERAEVASLTSEQDRDQLVKYWQWLLRGAGRAEVRRAVVYLTAHTVPPLADLQESLERSPAMALGWLSWRDVWRVARDCEQETGSLPARDLARLLSHKGFGGFEGFHGRPGLFTTEVAVSSFWRWFRGTGLHRDELSCGGHFWRGSQG